MTDAARSPSSEYEGLFLANREQVETAWMAASMTGLAPTIEPLLGAMIEVSPSERYSPEDRTMSVYIDDAGVKEEVVASLRSVIENTWVESHTSKAARGLLDILLEDPQAT